VLAWSQDRVGPICRTIEDCAMVFNAIHGADPKDPGTVTTPFHFDPKIRLDSVRIGVDAQAPKEFVQKLIELGAKPTPLAARPTIQGGGGLGVEYAAAFDFYVQMKAKELGIDVASIPEPPRGGAPGGGGGAIGSARPTDPGNPTGMAVFNRWSAGRFPKALDFVQAQRRRYLLITQMAELLKDVDMYVPGTNGYDVGLHAQTGHPCAVVQYKFEPQPSGRGGGGRGRATLAGAPADTVPPVVYNPQPICAVLAGNLYNDDKILSVAHQFQTHTDWDKRHPSI
jgi:Asp-tRNA(Asn)/Glu-tRNA(Gln) amidotransferase A subunit family amidase